jgi:hypothetical protein
MIEDMGEFGNSTPPPLPPGEQPLSPKSRSKARGVAAGVGVALVVAAGGGAVAASGGSSSSAGTPGATPTTEGTPAPGHGPGGRGPGLRGPGGGFGGFGGGLGVGAPGGVLHGTFVTSKSGGGYQTEQEQTGTVDAVTSTSLQVTSKDGFKATYVVPAGAVVGAQRDGISSVKKGDTVVVTAIVSGSKVTVSRLLDTTELKANAPAWTGPEGGKSGAPGAGQGPRGHRVPQAGSLPTAPPAGT